MQRLFVLLLIVSCIFMLGGCSKAVEITVPDNVSMVSIAPYDSEKMTFCYTDTEKIHCLKVINQIKTRDT